MAQTTRATPQPRPIEPMLLLHQERVRTVRIVFEQFSRALETLKRRSAGA